MSAIVNFSLDLTKLPKEKMIKGKKGTYIDLTAYIGRVDNFGNNASFAVSQTKEEREDENVERIYVGNGKVVFTDGEISVADRSASEPAMAEVSQEETDGLPF